MRSLRFVGISIAFAAVGCAGCGGASASGAPAGPRKCETPVECYDRALHALAETKEIWKQERAALALVPTGTVVAFAGNRIPDGWELCDGRALDRNDPKYGPLFQAIGTTHGGDGTPLFRLPDYRGVFLRGVDRGSGRDPDVGSRSAAGQDSSGNRGADLGSREGDAMVSHDHVIEGRVQEANWGTGFSGTGFESNSQPDRRRTYTTSAAGGSTETRPKNVYVDYIIKR
jgi:hypothetical protein